MRTPSSFIRSLHHARAVLALSALALPLGAQSAPAAPAAPPHDSIVSAVVSLIQSGDATARGQFLSRTLSSRARKDSARVDLFMARLHADGAPFTGTGSTRRSGRHAFRTLTSVRAGRTLSLQVSSEADGSPGLANVDFLETHPAVMDSLSWTADGGSDAALVRTVKRNLDRLAAAGAFSGVVYVARGDYVLLHAPYGIANREHGVPVRTRSRFSLASMTKMFTATAVLQLVEQGKLALDDTLGAVLPAYPSEERRSRITVRHLLGHTAGLGDMWSSVRKPVPGLTGPLAYAAAVAHEPLRFVPGSRWSYSNEGYAVLAAVVEARSGERFTDYIKRHILAPAGMTSTSLETGADEHVPDRATGYRPAPDDPLGVRAPRANWSFHGGINAMGGAGGGYSTTTDLARFGMALRDGKLLGAALRDSMWAGRWDIPGYAGEQYGLGSFVRVDGNRKVVGHGGGGTGSGMDNGFRTYTDGRYTVVVLTNMDPPAATQITERIVLMTLRGSQLAAGVAR